PLVASSIAWIWMLSSNGFVNEVMGLVLPVHGVAWLDSSAWALPGIMLVTIWQFVGYYTVLVLSGLQGIPHEIEEAARIDGAGEMRLAWSVTLPLLWLVSLSLQEPEAVFRYPPRFIPERLLWSSYPSAWRAQPFARMYVNSVVTSTLIILGQIVTSALAAYALTQLRFRGRGLAFLVIISTMMVPIQATFIPAYIIVSRLHWVDTYWALVMPFVASGFGIFLMRQAFLVVPQTLVEAARIDGAGHRVILTRILLPLARPALATMAALSFVFHYNDFFWPLIVT